MRKCLHECAGERPPTGQCKCTVARRSVDAGACQWCVRLRPSLAPQLHRFLLPHSRPLHSPLLLAGKEIRYNTWHAHLCNARALLAGGWHERAARGYWTAMFVDGCGGHLCEALLYKCDNVFVGDQPASKHILRRLRRAGSGSRPRRRVSWVSCEMKAMNFAWTPFGRARSRCAFPHGADCRLKCARIGTCGLSKAPAYPFQSRAGRILMSANDSSIEQLVTNSNLKLPFISPSLQELALFRRPLM